MPKKSNELGQRRRKGSDKRRRTRDLYGKFRPSRTGEAQAPGAARRKGHK